MLDKEKLSRGGMSGLLGFCFIFAGFAIMAAVNAMGEWSGNLGNLTRNKRGGGIFPCIVDLRIIVFKDAF